MRKRGGNIHVHVCRVRAVNRLGYIYLRSFRLHTLLTVVHCVAFYSVLVTDIQNLPAGKSIKLRDEDVAFCRSMRPKP